MDTKINKILNSTKQNSQKCLTKFSILQNKILKSVLQNSQFYKTKFSKVAQISIHNAALKWEITRRHLRQLRQLSQICHTMPTEKILAHN